MGRIGAPRAAGTGLAALVAVLLALTGPAVAQATAKAGDTFGDWIYECAPVGEGREACSLSQTLVDQQSGQSLLKFTLGRDEATGTVTLVALLPAGLDFVAGVVGAVDDKPGFPYTLRTCVGTTCIAMLLVDAPQLAQLKAGSALQIGFTMFGETQQRVFTGSLRGITAGTAAAGF